MTPFHQIFPAGHPATCRWVALFVLASALTGCASGPTPPCAAPAQRMAVDTLYFGTARAGGSVSAQEWAAFVDRTVTPRFPQGLTHWPASGQWRNGSGTIVREASRVLLIAHDGTAAQEAALGEIIAAYKTQFQQESVMRSRSRACVSF